MTRTITHHRPDSSADRVFPTFASYRRDAAKANRRIPIVQLASREPNAVA